MTHPYAIRACRFATDTGITLADCKPSQKRDFEVSRLVTSCSEVEGGVDESSINSPRRHSIWLSQRSLQAPTGLSLWRLRHRHSARRQRPIVSKTVVYIPFFRIVLLVANTTPKGKICLTGSSTQSSSVSSQAMSTFISFGASVHQWKALIS